MSHKRQNFTFYHVSLEKIHEHHLISFDITNMFAEIFFHLILFLLKQNICLFKIQIWLDISKNRVESLCAIHMS